MSATTLPVPPHHRWRHQRTPGALLLRRLRVERRANGEASSVMRMELRTTGGRLGGGEVVCDCRWRTCMDVQDRNRSAAFVERRRICTRSEPVADRMTDAVDPVTSPPSCRAVPCHAQPRTSLIRMRTGTARPGRRGLPLRVRRHRRRGRRYPPPSVRLTAPSTAVPDVGPAPALSSDAFDCLESSGADRVGEGLVVAFVLVGVGLGEVGDRLVEGVALAQVGGDRDRVP
jgi:hypothetical protein